MQRLLRVALASAMMLFFQSSSPILSQGLEEQNLGSRIEKGLNQKSVASFEKLFSKESGFNELIIRHKKFRKDFPNAKWLVNIIRQLDDESYLVEVIINGEKGSGGNKYTLSAKQVIEIKTSQDVIIDHRMISSYSITQSSQKPLSITLNIPEEVLTGTKYDVDVILNKPLGNRIIAGGLIALTPEQIKNQESPEIDLEPLGGGGLFKSVQAPLRPGVQNWAALLAHPEGIISVSKMVRVVNREEDLVNYSKGNL